MRCSYIMDWAGRCDKEVSSGTYCKEHLTKKCVVCGEQSDHSCDYTGQFVCGAPLCSKCEEYKKDGPSGAWGFLNHSHRVKLIEEETDELLEDSSDNQGIK